MTCELDGTGELLRALGALIEPPCPEHAAIARALDLPPPPPADEHTDVLVFQSYPYASVYLGAEGMLGGEARDRIAGLWRAIGAEPPVEPDHASVLFAALAELLEAEAEIRDDVRRAKLRRAGAVLFHEHVVSWMPPFLASVRRVGRAFHIAWVELVESVLVELAARFDDPVAESVHLRAAPPLPDAPDTLDQLLAIVLAPVRVGFTVVRADLVRCADQLALGLRAGERRFALRALVGQDARGVLAWLAEDAGRQAEALSPALPTTAWWQARSRSGSRWLARLAAAAGDRPGILEAR